LFDEGIPKTDNGSGSLSILSRRHSNFCAPPSSNDSLAMAESATCYTISPSNDSTLALEVSKTGLRRHKKHLLFFDKFSGEMRFAKNDPAAFAMTLTIDAASAVCRDAWLSEKKRRAVAEFARRHALAANIHPEIRFTAHSIRAKELRGFTVQGLLQIRGMGRVIKVNTLFGTMRKDCLQIDGDATLSLGDFGLPRPSAMFGLIGTKDEAAVRLLLWAIPRAEMVEAAI
jgi:polyisoprenoid-binding protein YceI